MGSGSKRVESLTKELMGSAATASICSRATMESLDAMEFRCILGLLAEELFLSIPIRGEKAAVRVMKPL
jgi:hypothetical protein